MGWICTFFVVCETILEQVLAPKLASSQVYNKLTQLMALLIIFDDSGTIQITIIVTSVTSPFIQVSFLGESLFGMLTTLALRSSAKAECNISSVRMASVHSHLLVVQQPRAGRCLVRIYHAA